MKPMMALGCAASAAVLLATALPAPAQQARTSFEDFGCSFDPGELLANGVISQDVFEEAFEEGRAYVGFVTSKNCPGSATQPAIQLNCEVPLDPDPGLTLSTRNFTCLISGAQCGFNQTFEGANNRLDLATAVGVNEDGDPIGRATIRCSRNVNR